MRARHVSAKESYVLHVSIRLDFWLLYNSAAVGAPLFCSSSRLWSSPSFPAHLLHNTQMSKGGGEYRAVEQGGGVLGWGPRGSGCLSQVNKCVWSEIREGRTQTKIPAEELLWQLWFSECEGCWTTGASRLAGKRTSGRVLAVACFLCMILNEKSDNSSETGCPIERQIPGVDRGPCSWPLDDLGSNKS